MPLSNKPEIITKEFGKYSNLCQNKQSHSKYGFVKKWILIDQWIFLQNKSVTTYSTQNKGKPVATERSITTLKHT